MSKRKKVFIIVLICFGVLVLGIIITGFLFLRRICYVTPVSVDYTATETLDLPTQSAFYTATPTTPALSKEEKELLRIQAEESDVENIVLIGIDRRSDEEAHSRSDSIMIATLDKPNKRLKLTSIMRDLYVPIGKGSRSNKINSAFNNGGADLLMLTINNNFSLSIENYITVDFSMFEKIVDALGGITIEMSSGEVSEANNCIAGLNLQRKDPRNDGLITASAGAITLTGKQALGYARMRHFGNGDFARTSRQYKVLQEIFSEFRVKSKTKQLQIIYDVLPLVETNLSPLQIVSLATQAIGMGTTDILHYRIPVEGMYRRGTVNGMWVLQPNIEENTEALHDFIFNATDPIELEMSETKK